VVDIPETVRRKALAVGAAQWLTALPALVSSLERDWSISVGRAYEDATEAFVAEAVVEGVAPAVLKLLVPRDGDAASNEITVLRLTDGAGCVPLSGTMPPGARCSWNGSARPRTSWRFPNSGATRFSAQWRPGVAAGS
jgi:hypothetical protein